MNCEEIKESARAGETIPESAMKHVQECPECSRTISQERELSGLVRALPRVTAPQAFDHALREKIESRRTDGNARGFRPGYLVPAAASLLFVLAAIYGFISLYSGRDAVGRLNVPEPAEASRPESSGDREPLQTPAEDPVGVPSDERDVSPRSPESGKRPSEGKRPTSGPGPGGGSIDLAASEPERILPPWMKRGAPEGNTPNRAEQSFDPSEILGELGINAVFEDGGWKVSSLRPKGIGARSGIRKGDIIKAIDGTELGTVAITGGAISGTSLTVIRDGRSMTIPISP